MTDYTELKRLAEAASNHEWFADDWSDYFGDDKTTIGFRTQEVIAAGNHGIWPEGIQWHRVASTEGGENPLADAAFIAAANPAAVLALIAENERLKNDHGDMILRNKVLRERPDLAAGRISCHDQVIALQAERDQLKADNDELRKDAERYRFGVENGHWTDAQIDAAVGKGEQS